MHLFQTSSEELSKLSDIIAGISTMMSAPSRREIGVDVVDSMEVCSQTTVDKCSSIPSAVARITPSSLSDISDKSSSARYDGNPVDGGNWLDGVFMSRGGQIIR